LQACEALAEAHALGIVHRDIKPSNFFITRDPGGALLLKLLDFGISKALGATGKLTGSQVILGTPAYMSPEQLRASPSVDARSDIWSLGVVLYELIEGVPPFEPVAFSAMLLQIVNDPPRKLTARIPAGLDGVIHRCLEKDPGRRFQSTAELAAALAPFAGSPAQAAITIERTRGLDPRSRRVATCADAARSQPSAAPSAPVRRWRGSLIVVVGILTGAGAVGLATLRDDATAAQLPGPSADLFGPAAAPGDTTPWLLAAPPPPAPPAPARESPSVPEPATGPALASPSVPEPAPGPALASPSADGGARPAVGRGRQVVPVRRPHRPKPAKTNRAPERTETRTETQDSASNATVSPRFDRGD